MMKNRIDLIVTHIGADFDALASLLAAKRLYPEALIVLPGSPDNDVREYLHRNSHLIELKKEREVDYRKVKRLIIVDTRLSKRIGEVKKALDNRNLKLHLFDHHPRTKGDLSGTVDMGGDYGATTTILVELIKKRRIKISPEEATLLALGIYEDTGSFTFPSTTPSDLRAVSFLLERGANLNVVSEFIRRELTKGQVKLLNRLFRLEKRVEINGIQVAIIKLESPDYIAGLAPVVHKLQDIENLDTIFVLLETKDRIRLVARSRIKAVDVGKIAQAFGGGGHTTAASATIRGMEVEDVERKLLGVLKAKVTSEIEPQESPKLRENVARLLKNRFPSKVVNFLMKVGKIADEKSLRVYLVGGFVRDLLLGVENFDIDFVVEDDGISFARYLVRRKGGRALFHRRFGTAQVTLPGDSRIDIATARKEFYEFPGALPKVEKGTLREDLYRRDFTINAMAIRLNPGRYGELVDFFGGWRDLKEGVIRVLHRRSFVEDPTRIFRAVRFEGRYDFFMDKETERLAIDALRQKILRRVSKERLREEIIAILEEPEPKKVILRLNKLGILKSIHPKIKLTRTMREDLDRAKIIFLKFKASLKDRLVERWILYFMILVQRLNMKDVKNLCKELKFSRGQSNKTIKGVENFLKIARKLSESNLKPSYVYRAVKGLPLEALLYIVLKAKSGLVKRRIYQYLNRMCKIKIHTTGEKLKKMGYKQGPIFKRIMEELLWAKLDGIVKGASSEAKFVFDNFRKG